MDVRCTVEMDFPDEARARAVHEALRPDDAPFVRSRREGTRVIAEAEARTPMSLLHTLEDYLACVGVAQGTADAADEGTL